MPNNRYQRHETSHQWEDIRPLLKDSAQITYEIIRPVLLFGISPKERAEETGMSKSSIYAKANLFDQAGEENIYCISVLENFSRAILASAITRRQDTEAFLSVLYAAV